MCTAVLRGNNMKPKDLFNDIHNKQIEGVMMHHALAMMFEFLNLNGFAEMQRMRYKNENKAMVKLEKYFIKHYNMLLGKENVNIKNYIPDDWFESNRFDVERRYKEDSVKNILEIWIEWERKNKKNYETAYSELIALRENAGAFFIESMICEVDYELCFAENIYLDLYATEFDIMRIEEMNCKICKKYKCYKERKVEENESES